MTKRCPTCQLPLEASTSRNDRNDLQVTIPEELVPLMAEVMREAHNRFITHGKLELTYHLKAILEPIMDAKSEHLRGFSVEGWTKVMEGISKGYDIRIETAPGTLWGGDPKPGHTDIHLVLHLEGREPEVICKATNREDAKVPGIIAYLDETFARFRPMAGAAPTA